MTVRQSGRRRLRGLALVLLGAAVYATLWRPHSEERERLERVVEERRLLLAMAREQAPERVRAPPAGPLATESLLVLVDRTARETGLGVRVERQTAHGHEAVAVHLVEEPFDGVVRWLGELSERFGVQVRRATLERGATPGAVRGQLVLAGNEA